MEKIENKTSPFIEVVPVLTKAGNILFGIWILYNGINEVFQGIVIGKIAYITLMLLVGVNAALLIRTTKNNINSNLTTNHFFM